MYFSVVVVSAVTETFVLVDSVVSSSTQTTRIRLKASSFMSAAQLVEGSRRGGQE